MYAYTYINACDAIGPAIHKNGLFYGREADFTRAVHEYERFYGREADFTRAVHEFERFYGRPIVSGQSGAGQPPSEVPPRHIALLHSPKTADGASQSPPEALPGHIALLHPARRRRQEVAGSQAVRRKPQTEQATKRSSIVSVPKPPRLPPWRAGRRRCPCQQGGHGGSGVSRRNGRPGR